jgi:hypothetical protein
MENPKKKRKLEHQVVSKNVENDTLTLYHINMSIPNSTTYEQSMGNFLRTRVKRIKEFTHLEYVIQKIECQGNISQINIRCVEMHTRGKLVLSSPEAILWMKSLQRKEFPTDVDSEISDISDIDSENYFCEESASETDNNSSDSDDNF